MNSTIDYTYKQPIAKVCGKALLEIPQGLYIPPDALEVSLENFQGPLDLLLYLIRMHNLNILDIPMAELTRQYMAYVEMMRADQLELISEYLLMTALLIKIKSCMLLPSPQTETEEEQDPRAELVRRLLEYEQIKKAAVWLNEIPQAEREFNVVRVLIELGETKQLPTINMKELHHAWISVLARTKINCHHQVKRETLSVRAYMNQILRDLHDHEHVDFHDLFNSTATIAEVVVIFLAILELAKELLIEIYQPQVFGIIHVRTTNTPKPA